MSDLASSRPVSASTATGATVVERVTEPIHRFMESAPAGGIVLLLCAAIAMGWANSPWAHSYHVLWDTPLTLAVGESGARLTLHQVINDGLMAVFFFLVGLEIKREVLVGELASLRHAALPVSAAIGGMVVPALLFTALNAGKAGAAGWGIPMATDIAFALGVLALLGSRVPVSLKVFLTALAIIDDLGAVLIIAAFYTADLSLPMLGGAGLTLAVLYGLNKAGVARLWPYLLLGVVLWVFVLKSGVHATIAGVLLALTIPLRLSVGKPDDPTSPLHILEHAVHPWSAYLILPIFGFANAGVSLAGITPRMLLDPVTLGVALGLFVGKQVGVFGLVLAAVRLGLAQRPAHATWPQVYGVSLLCGVGFTMSLFIGLLAFANAPELAAETKVGVLIGSLACMAAGALVLRFAPAHPSRR